MQKVEQEYKNYTNDEKERLFTEHCQSKYGAFPKWADMKDGKPDPAKYGAIFWHMTVVKPAHLYTN